MRLEGQQGPLCLDKEFELLQVTIGRDFYALKRF